MQRLEARESIRDVLYRYAHGSGSMEELGDLSHS